MLKEKNNIILLSGNTLTNFTKQINNTDSLQIERARNFLKQADTDLKVNVCIDKISIYSKSINFEKLDKLIVL